MNRYNQRGGAEIEQFRADKSGLHLSARRMRNLAAQKALILLTDLVHNLLADSRFADWGLKRIVRDLLVIPGRLHFRSGQLKRIELLASHSFANELIICLEKYCSSRFIGLGIMFWGFGAKSSLVVARKTPNLFLNIYSSNFE